MENIETSTETRERLIRNIDPQLLAVAKEFCFDTDNHEYVRGQAELIIDVTPGTDMEDKDELMGLLRFG